MRRTVFDLPGSPYRPGDPHRPEDMPLPESVRDRILYGADLFEHRAWWEAHVAWESAWLTFPRQSAEWCALKGMIQAAAMQLKTDDHLAAARERLKHRSSHHVQRALELGLTHLEGLRLRPFLRDVQDFEVGRRPLQFHDATPDRSPG